MSANVLFLGLYGIWTCLTFVLFLPVRCLGWIIIWIRTGTCNNYALMARNITYIREILHNEYEERFPDEDTLLIACGIIDTRSYNLPLEEIKIALDRAKKGECFLDNYQGGQPNEHNLMLFFKKNDLFLSFVLELEIMMFLRDSSFSRQDILTAVVSVIEKIEKAIGHTKSAYARGKRPLLCHRAVSNFMTSDAFDKVRDELGIVPSGCSVHEMPNNSDDLFEQLTNRQYWDHINPDIIKIIFNNAKGDVQKIKSFISISETFNLVGNNFVDLANNASKQYVTSLFALTLYQLGSGILKTAISAIQDRDNEKLEKCVPPADMAFASSILCDPYLPSPYVGMAILYSSVWINEDAALEFCRKYNEVEDKLLNTPDEELSPSQLSWKKSLNPEEFANMCKLVAEKSPHLLPDHDDGEFEGQTMGDAIKAIEAELLQPQLRT